MMLHKRPSSSSSSTNRTINKIAFSVAPFGDPHDQAVTRVSTVGKKNTTSVLPHPIARVPRQQNSNNNNSSTSFVLQEVPLLSPIPRPSTSTSPSSSPQQQQQQQHEPHSSLDQILTTTISFLQSVIKNSRDAALKLSLVGDRYDDDDNGDGDVKNKNQHNSCSVGDSINNSSFAQNNSRYDKAKREAAVASIAVLEGVCDLLSKFALSMEEKEEEEEERKKCARGSSLKWKDFILSVSSTIRDSLLGLKASLLPSLTENDNNVQNRNDNNSNNNNTSSSSQGISVIDRTRSRIKSYHRSLFFVPSSSGFGESSSKMSARIKNCDRMLEILRHQQHQQQHHKGLRRTNSTSALTANTNVWADAEDALHIMRLRFLFHLWRFHSKCERQRRLNAFRIVSKLQHERAKVAMLRVFLAMKRSQVNPMIHASQSLLKENKQLIANMGEVNERARKAAERMEQANILFRNAKAEVGELREKLEERERCPMIFDFRFPMRDLGGRGCVVEKGMIEFRRVHENEAKSSEGVTTTTLENLVRSGEIYSNEVEGDDEDDDDGKRTTGHGNQSSASASSTTSSCSSAVYPPFVDWSCPCQNEQSRNLIQLDHVKRLRDKKGIAMPGYRPPSSFYELRFTRGDLLNCSDTKTTPPHRYVSLPSTTMANGTLRRKMTLPSPNHNPQQQQQVNNHRGDNDDDDDVRHLVDEIFGSSFSSPKRWDREMCSMLNGVLRKLSPPSSSCGLLWEIDEPFSRQIVQREAFGAVIPSSVVPPPLKENEEAEDERNRERTFERVAVTATEQQRQQQTKRSPFEELLETTINSLVVKNAQDHFASVGHLLTEAADSFIQTTTRKLIDEAHIREEKQEQERQDVVKQTDVDVDGERERGSGRSQRKYNQHPAAQRTSSSSSTLSKEATHNYCAVAPPLLPPYLLLRENNLVIETPSDLITRPAITLRLLVIIFGKIAVMDCLRTYYFLRSTEGFTSSCSSSPSSSPSPSFDRQKSNQLRSRRRRQKESQSLFVLMKTANDSNIQEAENIFYGTLATILIKEKLLPNQQWGGCPSNSSSPMSSTSLLLLTNELCGSADDDDDDDDESDDDDDDQGKDLVVVGKPKDDNRLDVSGALSPNSCALVSTVNEQRRKSEATRNKNKNSLFTTTGNNNNNNNNNNSHQQKKNLLLGRELCSLIQFHLTVAMAHEEDEVKNIESNQLMMRRMKASLTRQKT